ncbi:MAG: hypothetical protein HYZ54_10945 [Ignavibacteriae bacterium]|nr:hypothetical protein [Ignavibacteriota bacterium]
MISFLTFLEFFATLPPFALVIIGAIVLGIVFAIARRLVKFALSIAALTILILVIIKLVNH